MTEHQLSSEKTNMILPYIINEETYRIFYIAITLAAAEALDGTSSS